MKKLLTAFGLSALLLSCGTSTGYKYDIEASVVNEDLNGKMIFLYAYDFTQSKPEPIAIDSVMIENYAFKFEGSTQSPTILTLASGESSTAAIKANNQNSKIIQEQGIKLNVSGQVEVTAGELNLKSKEMENRINEISEHFKGLVEQGAGDMDDIYKQYISEINAHMYDVIEQNGDNALGLSTVLVYNFENIEQIDSILTKAPVAKDVALIAQKREGMLNLLKTSVGKPFADFTGQAIDGAESKLSDYAGKGKVVLVDFWASWCGPCHAIIPEIKSMQEKYGDELVILSVNVWDKKDAFHKMLDEGKMTWNHIYASDDNEVPTLYGIEGIPTLLVLDTEGNIASRGHGVEFKEAIDELLKK